MIAGLGLISCTFLAWGPRDIGSLRYREPYPTTLHLIPAILRLKPSPNPDPLILKPEAQTLYPEPITRKSTVFGLHLPGITRHSEPTAIRDS